MQYILSGDFYRELAEPNAAKAACGAIEPLAQSAYPAQCAGSSHQRDTSERGLPYGNAEWQTRRPGAHEIAHGPGRSKVSWALRKI